MLLRDFQRLAPQIGTQVSDGLAAAIDEVADRAAPSHRFLRYGWYAAALHAYGGAARTLIVTEDRRPTLALPLVAVGPAWLGLAAIPGCYWPFRSFVMSRWADQASVDAALVALAATTNAVRIGPVHDGDVAATRLIDAARGAGWAVLDRFVADSWVLDIAADDWPRRSTLRKNRFHEKHLALLGACRWERLRDDELVAAFDRFAAIEARSWIATRTDGSDAKFTPGGHGGFWRAAASDPVLASMLRGSLLSVDGVPAAYSFDIAAGRVRHAIANSYDPVFAKHSAGKLLQYRSLAEAAAEGVTTIDWGAGDSGYKQAMGAVRGPAIRDWLLLRPGAPATIGAIVRGLWRGSGRRPDRTPD